MRKPITPEGFEALFRRNGDPWDYRASPFEAWKRSVLLRACGDRTFGRGLELACANGETALRLADRCLRLLAVDAAPTALALARRRTRHQPRIRIAPALLPGDMPRGSFDLIVASEIVYYLDRRDGDALGRGMLAALAPGGRIVVLHHLWHFDDAAQPPRRAHARLCTRLGDALPPVFHERHGRFDCAAYGA